MFKFFKKKEVLGYFIIFYRGFYEQFPRIYIFASESNDFDALIKLWDDQSYWINKHKLHTIPLYEKDVKRLLENGYDISKSNYRINTEIYNSDYDDYMSKRKILKKYYNKKAK